LKYYKRKFSTGVCVYGAVKQHYLKEILLLLCCHLEAVNGSVSLSFTAGWRCHSLTLSISHS